MQVIENIRVGNNCKIHGRAVLDVDPFIVKTDESGKRYTLESEGGIILGDEVEIGQLTVVERGFNGYTRIGDRTKIANLVVIGHDADIGEDNIIVDKTFIAGHVKTGKGVFIGGNASIKQKITIGDYALVGMGAVVVKDVKPYEVVCGNPAKVLRVKPH